MAKEFSTQAFAVMAAKYPYPTHYYKEFLNTQSKHKDLEQTLHMRANFLQANEEQRMAYKTITDLLSDGKQHTIIVEGSAGVGKSELSSLIVHYVHEKLKMKYIASAHLAVAAAALNGSSLYSTLSIYTPKIRMQHIPTLPLSGVTKHRLAKTKLLVLDEASLIG